MGWLGGDDTTSTSSTQVDASSGLQDVHDTNVITLGQVSGGANVTVTDKGAVNAAIKAVSASSQSVVDAVTGQVDKDLAFAGQAATQSNNLVIAAGKAVLDQVDKDRAFAGQAAQSVINAVTGEADKNRAFAGQAASLAASASANALSAAKSSFSEALGTVSGSLDKVFSFLAGGLQLLQDDRQSTIDAVTGSSLDNNKLIAQNAKDTLQGITSFVADVLGKTDDHTNQLIMGLNSQNSDNIKILGEATRSDTAKSLDKLVTVAGVVVVAAVVATLYLRGKS